MKYSVLIASLALAAAKSERYIISYDDLAWNSLSLKYLPTNTVHILKELRMQVADLDMAEISELNAIPGVTLHKDAPVFKDGDKPTFVENNPPAWGIDRIDQDKLPLDKQYHFDLLGSGVDVYVVDTGVRVDHVEFGGRAKFSANFAGDGKDTDCDGHGTHVSSTVAGFTVGVAKGANIHGVKVLNCYGSGAASNVVAGINHVVTEHKKAPGKKSVISMSLGYLKSEGQIINDAVAVAYKAGVVVVVSAGNNGYESCRKSPASAPDAITVAASDINDTHASFSNFGECVDIYAPGVDILGADFSSKDGYVKESGTSMSTPHVSGAAALALEKGIAPAEVKKYLVETGIKDVIKNVPAKTPNVLLNVWKH